MYLEAATDNCTECPVGQYMDTDGTTSCKMCPSGQSTEKMVQRPLKTASVRLFS